MMESLKAFSASCVEDDRRDAFIARCYENIPAALTVEPLEVPEVVDCVRATAPQDASTLTGDEECEEPGEARASDSAVFEDERAAANRAAARAPLVDLGEADERDRRVTHLICQLRQRRCALWWAARRVGRAVVARCNIAAAAAPGHAIVPPPERPPEEMKDQIPDQATVPPP